jgi:hypothetical protein
LGSNPRSNNLIILKFDILSNYFPKIQIKKIELMPNQFLKYGIVEINFNMFFFPYIVVCCYILYNMILTLKIDAKNLTL